LIALDCIGFFCLLLLESVRMIEIYLFMREEFVVWLLNWRYTALLPQFHFCYCFIIRIDDID
jgi:hypothetical protein